MPHVPLELAALAVSAGAHVRADRRLLSRWELATAVAAATLLTALAAVVETWAVPHT